jgi:hypothetical protein
MGKNVVSIRQPKTLMQAHEQLVRMRPARDASLSAWLAYYRHSVAVYEQIAKVDPCHDVEARYWAQREQARAQQIAARIAANRPSR